MLPDRPKHRFTDASRRPIAEHSPPRPRQSTPPHFASVADILAVNGGKGGGADL